MRTSALMIVILFILLIRKQGSVFCTAQGLTSQEVRSLTKHNRDIFEKTYMCELSIKVMKTIAGFIPDNKDDKYNVPRSSRNNMPGDITVDQATTALFPNIDEWKMEIESENGDKSGAAKEFLDNVLPHLSKDLIQDGVLWSHYHPGNPAVLLLHHRLHGRTGNVNYSTWCSREFTIIAGEATALNNALHVGEYESMKRKMREMVSSIVY